MDWVTGADTQLDLHKSQPKHTAFGLSSHGIPLLYLSLFTAVFIQGTDSHT